MAYGIKYQLTFTNRLGEILTVQFKRKDYIGDYQQLIGGSLPITIRSLAGDDDPFAPILSKECQFSIHLPRTQNVGLLDFITLEDDDWLIEVYNEIGSPAIFIGHLLPEDCSEPLFDKPYEITIRASDGLALLKNKPFPVYDFSGDYPVIEYIIEVLYAINPSIKVRSYYDIYHSSMDQANDSLKQLVVDARTFENVTAYEGLQRILSSIGARLFFESGYWHVVGISVYMREGVYKYYEHDFSGVLGSGTHAYSASIGKRELVYAINKDAIRYLKVPSREVTTTYDYEVPSEVVCNQQLTRGARIPSKDQAYNPVTESRSEAQEWECWTQTRATSGYSTEKYIVTEYDAFNYEKDKYIRIKSLNPGGAPLISFASTEFYVEANTTIGFEADMAYGEYSALGRFFRFRIILHGDNGVYYSIARAEVDELSDVPAQWIVVAFPYYDDFATAIGAVAEHQPVYKGVKVTTEKLPVSGYVHIELFEFSNPTSSPSEQRIKNINISFKNYIGNSFKPAKGDYNRYSQAKNINKTIEVDSYISDSPARMLKGSIFVNGILPTPQWSRQGISESFRFTQLQTLLKYSMNDSTFIKIEGTMRGLSYFVDNIPVPFGFLPQYKFVDVDNNVYILCSMDVDYKAATWRGVFIQLETTPTVIADYIFKYIFE